MVTVEMLDAIERCDPDGGDVEPTDEMYAAHEQWAIASFGKAAWDRYRVGGWAEGSWY